MIAKKYCIATLLSVALMSSCGNRNGEEHHHHDEMLQVAAYSDNIEVFAEISPMSTEEESHILAHFTNLSDFRPIGESAEVKLTVGGKSVTAKAEKPERPGIFKFEIMPPAVGEAQLEFSVVTGGEKYCVTAANLEVFTDEHKAAHEAEEHEIKSSNAAVFSKEMAWKSDFMTSPVEMRELGDVIMTMGLIESLQGETRTVTARNSGTVNFVNGDLIAGSQVGSGQTLFRIDATQTAENNLGVQLRELKAEYESARLELEREEGLFKERLTTASEVNEARKVFESAKARYDHLKGNFGGGGGVISSPISGYITSLDVKNGQYVEAGQSLATVSQNKDVIIKAEVAPSYFPVLDRISDVTISRPNTSSTWTLKELDGSVLTFGRSLGSGNPLVPVSFKVRNVADFIPGTYVNLHISTAGKTPVVAVPNSALIEEMGVKFVYVQLTPELFEKRQVETGTTDGRYTTIISGVKEGDRVVSKGAVLVKLSHSTGALDPHAGHVH